MRAAHAQALDLLRLRSSSRLFRLGDAAAIRAKVTFPVSGTWAQIPGVIVMVLDDTVGRPVDAQFARIAVVFNAATWPVRQVVETLPGAWELHPVQQGGADPIVKTTSCKQAPSACPDGPSRSLSSVAANRIGRPR